MKKVLCICLYVLLLIVAKQEFALAQVPFPDQTPAWNTIGPWGHAYRYNWKDYRVNGQVVSKPGTSDYVALMYNVIPFRLMTPNGVTIDIEVDQDGKPTGPIEWIFNEPGKKYPLLFFMHGAGEAGDNSDMDNEHQLIHGAEKFRNAVLRGEFDGYVLFPHSANGFWANSTVQRRSVEIIQKMIAEYNVDKNRIIAAGLSSGAKGTWHAINEWPEVFASAIAMSGAPVKYSQPDLISNYVEMPIWMSNGGLDDDPSPFTAAKVADAVKNAGGNIRRDFYPNAGHATWNQTFNDSDFYPFLNRYSKTSIHVFYDETEFSAEEPFSVKLGVTKGFDEYQWMKDGVVIPNSNNRHLTVTKYGAYNVRLRRGSEWTAWSNEQAHVDARGEVNISVLTTQGLYYSYYEQEDLSSVSAIENLSPTRTGRADNFGLGLGERSDNFAFKFEGFINISTAGEYTFYTSSDDGSQLFIGDQRVVDNDGLHGKQERSGSISLTAGSYPITVLFFERGGGNVLEVRYQGPGISKRLIPDTVLMRDNEDISFPPVANAGEDQTVEDEDDSGSEAVTLNGSGSSDSDGSIASYVWSKNGSQLASGVTPTVSLAVGSHTIVLMVTDDQGETDSDEVVITVNEPTANQAPQANSVSLSGTTEVGKVLSGTYTYADADNDPEGPTGFQWYKAESAGGLNEVPISGATQLQYSLTTLDEKHYLRLGITPRALTGTVEGTETFSAYSTVIMPAQTGGGDEALQTWKISIGNGRTDNLPSSDWFTLNQKPSTGSLVYSGLTNSEGNVTGVSLNVFHRESGSFVHGIGTDGYVTGNNSGVYPDKVIANLWYSHSAIEFKISNLDPTKKYKLTFFGSSSSSTYRPQKFIIDGQEAFLNTAQNQFNTAVLEDLVPDSNNELDVVCTNDGIRTIVLNAFVLEEFEAGNAARVVSNAKTKGIGNDANQALFAKSEAVAYPNPFSESFTVLLPSSETATELLMIDALGREVYRETTSSAERILEIPQILPGVYFLQVRDKNDVQIIRLVKK